MIGDAIFTLIYVAIG